MIRRETDIYANAVRRAQRSLRRVRRLVARVGRDIGRATLSIPRARAARGVVEAIVAEGRLVPAGSPVTSVQIGAEAIIRVSVRPVDGGQPILFALAPDMDNPGRAALERSIEALRALSGVALPPGIRQLLPIPPLEAGKRDGWTWLAQRELPGRSAERIAESGRAADREHLLQAGSAAIELLHRSTARAVLIDAAWLGRWGIARAGRMTELSPRSQGDMEQIGDWIGRAIRGLELPVAWIHGDLWPRNILVGDDGARVTGLVDWESAAPDEHPCQDAVHLILMSRRLSDGGSIGARIIEALATPAWTAAEASALARGGLDVEGQKSNLPGARIPIRVGVLLCWLRLVSENVVRRPALARHVRWIDANVRAVGRAAVAEIG